VNGFNVVYQQFTAMYDRGLSVLLWLVHTQAGFQGASTSKYHAADKQDTPTSHFKLTMGQPALL